MPLEWFDHALAALYFVALPAHGYSKRHQLEREVAAGHPDARLREYRKILGMLVCGSSLLIGWWVYADRPAALLRIALPGTSATVALVLASLGAAGFLVRRLVLARRDPARMKDVLELLSGAAGAEPLIPRSARERALFRWVSLAAGVGEELIFRGFGLWYVAQFSSPWVAVIVTALAFAAGHAYQGLGGVLRTGVFALGFGAGAVSSGTILPLMVLHTVVDLVNGELLSNALEWRDREALPATGSAVQSNESEL